MSRFRQWMEWLLIAVALAAVSYTAYLRGDDSADTRKAVASQASPLLATPPQSSPPKALQPQAATDAKLDQKLDAQSDPKQDPKAEDSDKDAKDAKEKPHNSRVVFITSKDSKKSAEELARLSKPGGEFDKLKAAGWKIGAGEENHLQIIDREKIPDLVERLKVTEFPTVACVEDGEIIRSFKSGCRTPLDCWTFGFLAKGVDERPPGAVLQAAYAETTNNYPLRGNHWSVEDDWNPTREKVITHLRGPNHGSQILASQKIETWSYEELRSLHDDLHEREGITYAPSNPLGHILNPHSPNFH